jgi:hypothetical protein
MKIQSRRKTPGFFAAAALNDSGVLGLCFQPARLAAIEDERCGAYLVLHPNPPPMLEEGISTKLEIG